MEIKLWHGGRNLEYSYKELRGSKKGQWEHGAGLYVTTHYDTAYSYSKGGGKTYMIHMDIDPDKDLYSKTISLENALNFISQNCKKNKINILSSDINNDLKRRCNLDTIKLETLQNLIINHEAIPDSKSYLLNEFIVESGVQYGLVSRFKGRDETVIVIYDREIIKKVQFIPAKEVTQDLYEIDLPPFNFKKILNEKEIKEELENNFTKKIKP